MNYIVANGFVDNSGNPAKTATRVVAEKTIELPNSLKFIAEQSILRLLKMGRRCIMQKIEVNLRSSIKQRRCMGGNGSNGDYSN